jgi:hypothetical protein
MGAVKLTPLGATAVAAVKHVCCRLSEQYLEARQRLRVQRWAGGETQ